MPSSLPRDLIVLVYTCGLGKAATVPERVAEDYFLVVDNPPHYCACEILHMSHRNAHDLICGIQQCIQTLDGVRGAVCTAVRILQPAHDRVALDEISPV
jgi:hypothetical protein